MKLLQLTPEQHGFELHLHGYFSIVSSIVLHSQRLVRCMGMKSIMWRVDYKLYVDFPLWGGSAS